MKDTLPYLAQEARRLGLDTPGEETEPEKLLEFAGLVLDELAAQGLLEGVPDIGCWAQRRSSAN